MGSQKGSNLKDQEQKQAQHVKFGKFDLRDAMNEALRKRQVFSKNCIL
uniref:Uncharacterized protein n=1 Tax=Arundo donax TaxID=35708 RepID=A0A0A9HBW3_ARUDO